MRYKNHLNMRKTTCSIVLACFAIFATILSCTKPYINSGTVNVPEYQTLNKMFAAFRTSPSSFSVQAGRDTVVYAPQGTRFHFYPYSFATASGDILTGGTIDLQVIEMYKPGDMISNRATTMAGGHMLLSGGQISVSAKMGGVPVYANKYGLGYPHNTYSGTTMNLYFGGAANADSVVTWTIGDTTKNGATANGTAVDTGSRGNNYFFFDTCSSFNWANCDWFAGSDSILTTVSVVLPDTSFNANNTQLYLVLHAIRAWGGINDTLLAVLSNVESGLGSGSYNASTNTLKIISEGNSAIVPAGSSYELIVLSCKSGSYYYYSQKGTIPHSGLTATASPVLSTQSAIMTQLQGL